MLPSQTVFASDESHMPTRPSLPTLLLIACGMWLGCAVTFSCIEGFSAMQCSVLICIGGVFVLIALLVFMVVKGHATSAVCLGVVLGCACAGVAQLDYVNNCSAVETAHAGRTLTFQVGEDARLGDFGYSCTARCLLDGKVILVRVNLPEGMTMQCWDVFSATTTIKLPNEKARTYYRSKGLAGSCSPSHITREQSSGLFGLVGYIRSSALEQYSQDDEGTALMKGIIFGQRSDLFSSTVYSDVKACGLAHTVAVSGAHLSIIVSLVSVILQRLRTPRAICVVVLAVFIVLYVLFTGAPQSAIRAGIMTCCMLASFFARRRGGSLAALGLCVIVLIAADPLICVSISFALSAGATLGIILFSTLCSRWCAALFGKHQNVFSDVAGMTLAANLFTLPVSIATFGQFSLISPFANLIIGPLFSLICTLGVVCTVIGFVFPFAITGSALLGTLFCEIVHLLARIPYASIPATGDMPVLLAASALFAVFLWCVWPAPHPTRAWGVVGATTACLCALLFVVPLLHGDEIIMLDVGQGDAIVLRSGGRTILIDTGTNDTQVLEGLARHDIRALDAIAITHPDDDHCGSLPALLAAMPVQSILVANDLLTCSCSNCTRLRASVGEHTLTPVNAGDKLLAGHMSIDVLSPHVFQDEGGNADSLVMTVRFDCNSDDVCDVALLTSGDAEADILWPLAQSGQIGNIDILKVPHHGSAGGVTDSLLDVLTPNVALISVGADNRYGHPTQETLDYLQAHNIETYRTDQQGDVVCSLEPDKITITPSGVQ